IDFYHRKDPFFEFCNFYASPIQIDHTIWPTSEHYFQAQKFIDQNLQKSIRQCQSPREAFINARCHSKQLRQDWEASSDDQIPPVKEQVMYNALKAKFTQHPHLLTLLLSTGNALIREHTSHDAYWGDGGGGRGAGKNRLGILLMQLRI
ncbi:MAG: PF08719 domain protein, partial [Piptocephalis tieghemiana]